MRDIVLKADIDGNFGNDVSVVLGCSGESLVTRLLFTLPVFNGNYYIDIELPDGQIIKDSIMPSGDIWEYTIPYPVTKNIGIGAMQIVVTSHDEVGDTIWKSATLATKVHPSINATDFILNEYRDIFAQIDDKFIDINDVVNSKVSKQDGKMLSTNDYTTEDKTKLANIIGNNTGDQDLSGLIPVTQKASANGVATLNSNSKTVQMPEVQKLTTIISNPDFTNQPTISGNLSATFERWETNFYFVTLKDTAGVALSSGQFKLTATKDGYATAINQIFTLVNLATGNSGTLAENTAVDFSAIGTSWKMRLRYVSSVSINLTGDLQLSDMQIDISGMINTSYTLNILLTPFNTNSYLTMSSVGGYLGSNGFVFAPSSGQTKKFIFNSSIIRILRRKKEISAEYQVQHAGGDVINGSYTTTQASSNGTLFAMNRIDLNTIAVTNIGITSSTMLFANGTEITIKELL